jgi:hypothetical protein
LSASARARRPLDRSDTVYCLTPLHHQSGLLVSLGGAVVGGARIALSRGLQPERFAAEIRQYGVTVVSYTWAMLRDVIDDPAFVLHGHHPVRLFIGRACRPAVAASHRDVRAGEGGRVLRDDDGQAVLANVTGAKVGSKGRPLPGGGEIELAAYDVDSDLILEDDRGFVQVAAVDQIGVLLAHPRGPVDPTASVKRGVFAPSDIWVSTESLFRRDADGDYWLVGNRNAAIHTARGVTFPEPITEAVSRIGAVDLAVTYPVPTTADHEAAVAALTLRPGGRSRRPTSPMPWRRCRSVCRRTSSMWCPNCPVGDLPSDGRCAACRRVAEGGPAGLVPRSRGRPVQTTDRDRPHGDRRGVTLPGSAAKPLVGSAVIILAGGRHVIARAPRDSRSGIGLRCGLAGPRLRRGRSRDSHPDVAHPAAGTPGLQLTVGPGALRPCPASRPPVRHRRMPMSLISCPRSSPGRAPVRSPTC